MPRREESSGAGGRRCREAPGKHETEKGPEAKDTDGQTLGAVLHRVGFGSPEGGRQASRRAKCAWEPGDFPTHGSFPPLQGRERDAVARPAVPCSIFFSSAR